MISYKTQGVCSSEINFDIVDNKIKDVNFVGGCNGNLKGVGILAEGMDADEFVAKCQNIKCGNRPTSCPAQLAQAIIKAKASV